MDIVIDTSAIIAVIANEPEKAKLIKLTKGVNLIAPQSVHWETGNAFSAMLKRKKISLTQAIEAVKVYHQIPIRFIQTDLIHSLELALDYKIYAYDAYIISCALIKKCPMLSLDKALVKHSKKAGVKTLEI